MAMLVVVVENDNGTENGIDGDDGEGDGTPLTNWLH